MRESFICWNAYLVLELEKPLLKQLINFLGKKICAVEDK
jgi:hypothetical protein